MRDYEYLRDPQVSEIANTSLANGWRRYHVRIEAVLGSIRPRRGWDFDPKPKKTPKKRGIHGYRTLGCKAYGRGG